MKIVLGKVDWKALRNRVAAGEATQNDAEILMASCEDYRRRVQEVYVAKEREVSKLRKKVADFEFTLKMVRDTVKPDDGHEILCHCSQFDLFQALMEPERIRALRTKIADEYLHSMRDNVRWNVMYNALESTEFKKQAALVTKMRSVIERVAGVPSMSDPVVLDAREVLAGWKNPRPQEAPRA